MPTVPGTPKYPRGEPLLLPRARKRKARVAPYPKEFEKEIEGEREERLQRLEKRLKGRAI